MPSPIVSIEVISTGTDLLLGKTLNSNARFLASRISSLGGRVGRITVVGDDVKEIASAVKEALARKPSMIITTGGLGPTMDDRTLEGISIAIKRSLAINKEALSAIKAKYEEMLRRGLLKKMRMTAPRMKMAYLPRGSKVIMNPVGTAPGALIKYGGTVIVALPGVPAEMESMFEESVAPIIRSMAGERFASEEILRVTGILESDLAPIVTRVTAKNPLVYVKSHPKGAERVSRIELHLSSVADSLEIAKENVRKAVRMLSRLIKKKGGKVAGGKGCT